MSVNQFVDAIKGDTVRGYGTLPIGGNHLRISQDNASEASSMLGIAASELLRAEKFKRKPVLVPFPSSKCTRHSIPAGTRPLADAIAEHIDVLVADILRFRRHMPSAHREGGTRDPKLIFANLRVVEDVIPGRPYVLVDDILTSTGHVRAGIARLKEAGARIALVICAASAGQTPSPRPFQAVQRQIEDFEPE